MADTMVASKIHRPQDSPKYQIEWPADQTLPATPTNVTMADTMVASKIHRPQYSKSRPIAIVN
jgi:hypothetical protein